jgi:hypothetical protein
MPDFERIVDELNARSALQTREQLAEVSRLLREIAVVHRSA